MQLAPGLDDDQPRPGLQCQQPGGRVEATAQPVARRRGAAGDRGVVVARTDLHGPVADQRAAERCAPTGAQVRLERPGRPADDQRPPAGKIGREVRVDVIHGALIVSGREGRFVQLHQRPAVNARPVSRRHQAEEVADRAVEDVFAFVGAQVHVAAAGLRIGVHAQQRRSVIEERDARRGAGLGQLVERRHQRWQAAHREAQVVLVVLVRRPPVHAQRHVDAGGAQVLHLLTMPGRGFVTHRAVVREVLPQVGARPGAIPEEVLVRPAIPVEVMRRHHPVGGGKTRRRRNRIRRRHGRNPHFVGGAAPRRRANQPSEQ